MTNQYSIQTQDLTKNFGDFTAVDSVSIQIKPGEIFGFLGPNGSGKTTTIRMMLGLLKPSFGSIAVMGASIPDDVQQVLPRIGYMSQQFSLYNDLTIRQNLDFYGQAYGIANSVIEQKIKEAVSLAGLVGYENTTTSELSGGWRQRLALSAAILHKPEVLFLDEPTAGVDPVSRRAFWDLLYELVAEGITVFITTHYMDEAEHCHRLAFIQHGKIIAQGTPKTIKKESLKGGILEIKTPQPEDLIQFLTNYQQQEDQEDFSAELYGSLVHVFTSQLAAHIRTLPSLAQEVGIEIQSITEIDPSLEDVFISCMKTRKSGGTDEK